MLSVRIGRNLVLPLGITGLTLRGEPIRCAASKIELASAFGLKQQLLPDLRASPCTPSSMNQQRQHNLLQLGAQLGYPAARVDAVFRRMVDLHGRGDASKLGLQHQDEFLDKLSGLEDPAAGGKCGDA